MIVRAILAVTLIGVLISCGTRRRSSVPNSAEADQSTDSSTFGELRDVLRAGHFSVDVLELAPSTRLQELMERVQRAMRDDPQWWLHHVANAAPGEPLPYDQRVGLTKDEYGEYMGGLLNMKTRVAGQASLRVTEEAEGIFRLDGGTTLPELSGIEIDLEDNVVRTAYGVLDAWHEVKASPEQRVTGPWTGRAWKYEPTGPSGPGIKSVKFHLGRLEQSGRVLLNFDVKKLDSTGWVRIAKLITYDCD